MREAADHSGPALAKHRESFVSPGPVAIVRPLGRDILPQNRIADSRDTEIGDQVYVAPPVSMSRFFALIPVLVAEPDDGTFNASPHLEPGIFCYFHILAAEFLTGQKRNHRSAAAVPHSVI